MPVATPQLENKTTDKQQKRKYLSFFMIRSLIRVGHNFYKNVLIKKKQKKSENLTFSLVVGIWRDLESTNKLSPRIIRNGHS